MKGKKIIGILIGMLIIINVFQIVCIADNIRFYTKNNIVDKKNCSIDKVEQNIFYLNEPILNTLPPSLRIRTIGWYHLDDSGTAVVLCGSLGILYSMGLYDVGFYWGLSGQATNKIYADDYGILNTFYCNLYNLNRHANYSFIAFGLHKDTGIEYTSLFWHSFVPGQPVIITNNATNINQNSATLNGNLYHMGGASSCQVWFKYGTSSENLDTKTDKITMTSKGQYSESIIDLISGTKYYFKAFGSNDCGTVSGFEFNFTTSGQSENKPPAVPEKPIGPTIGKTNSQYTYFTSSIDPEGDKIRYGWDWIGDGNIDEWSDFFISGNKCNLSHIWTSTGTFNIKVLAEDANGKQSDYSQVLSVIITNPPEKPTITGQASGKPNTEYDYRFISTDSEGDDIYYCIDWGDNTGEVCIGPYMSGIQASAKHSWSEIGDYTIKAKAKDLYGIESDWESFIVTISKSKVISIQLFLQKIFQHFLFFEKILNRY